MIKQYYTNCLIIVKCIFYYEVDRWQIVILKKKKKKKKPIANKF